MVQTLDEDPANPPRTTDAATATAAPPTTDDGARPRLGDTWLLHKAQLLQLILSYVALVGIWTLAGKLLTGPLEDGAIVRADQRIAQDLADGRTERMNDLTHIGTLLAETMVKIVATAIVAAIMLAIWKRWREPLMMIVPLVLEAAAFITITTFVGRSRPSVERLEGSPVDSSFPSGHAAAAACYVAFAIVVAWHTRHRWIPLLVTIVLLAVPVVVGYSRMYRGMHFLSDVIAGGILGLVAVGLSWLILERAPEGRLHLPHRDQRH